MTAYQQSIAIIASSIVLVLIFELVRRRSLREEYSMLWLLAGGVLLFTSLYPSIIDWLASLLGIDHPAYGMFVLAFLLGFILAVHFTVILSRLTAQAWRLTQEVGLMRAEIDRLNRISVFMHEDRSEDEENSELQAPV